MISGAEKKKSDEDSLFGEKEDTIRMLLALILFVIPSAIAIWWYIKDLRARRQKEDGDID